MATSPNFGWAEPDNTSLVKDGAQAIRTLGNAIDASMAELLGGTTGQVLSKTSNTNMDFTWVTSDDANAIQNTIVDAKGDLISATGSDVPARLAVGANDLVLTADSAEATGLKYTGGWTTWTPTYTNMTVGNGSVIARYQKIGKLVTLYFRFVLGSTSTISTSPSISLPISSSQSEIIYPCRYLDSGVTNYFGIATMGGGTTILSFQEMRVNGTYGDIIGNITATVPFTWAVNDTITVQASYEVA